MNRDGFLCLTCSRPLKPHTSVPRWSDETIAMNENSRKFYEEQVAARKKEIDEQRLGLYGESQFCNKDCACFFARTCVQFFTHIEFIPSPAHERLAMVTRLAEKLFQWVKDRKAK